MFYPRINKKTLLSSTLFEGKKIGFTNYEKQNTWHFISFIQMEIGKNYGITNVESSESVALYKNL